MPQIELPHHFELGDGIQMKFQYQVVLPRYIFQMAPRSAKAYADKIFLVSFSLCGTGGTNGKCNAPGLPEMLGSFSLVWSNNWTFPSNGAAGCFYLSDVQPASTPPYNGSAGYNLASNVRIQASRSSSVYGASSTVMPASADVSMGLYLGRLA